jgi:hypothetical protein
MQQSPSDKLPGFQLVKKFPKLYWPRKFINAFTSARHLPLSSASSIQTITLTSYFLKSHINITLPSTPGSSNWSLFLRFPHQNPVYTSTLAHTCHMPRPSHSSRLYHPNNIGWGISLLSLYIFTARSEETFNTVLLMRRKANSTVQMQETWSFSDQPKHKKNTGQYKPE